MARAKFRSAEPSRQTPRDSQSGLIQPRASRPRWCKPPSLSSQGIGGSGRVERGSPLLRLLLVGESH